MIPAINLYFHTIINVSNGLNLTFIAFFISNNITNCKLYFRIKIATTDIIYLAYNVISPKEFLVIIIPKNQSCFLS